MPPLLDGKYEIHGERSLGAGVTRFDATAPDGAPVKVEWLELAGEDDLAFERYRRLLKRLAREGRAHLQDVVARPGARYVAWYLPPDGPDHLGDPALHADLRQAGFDPASAQFRRIAGTVRLTSLPFRPLPEPLADPQQDLGPTRRGRPLWARPADWPGDARSWALSLLIALSAGGLFWLGFVQRANDRLVTLPAVVGSSYDEVAPMLHALGLRVTPVLLASGEEGPGEVLASEPAEGSVLRPGREVQLTVALPPGRLAPTTVPRLVGANESAIAAAVEQAGLGIGHLVRVHADAPAGIVLAQRPAANLTVGQGSTVDAVVSLGPEPLQSFVPDLVGLPLSEALALAAVAGLGGDQVVVERLAVERPAPDVVLSQSLPPYRAVVLGQATLRLVVSEVMAPIALGGLPALGGMSETQAVSLAGGFDLRIQYVSDGNLPDGVVAQSLPVGAQAHEGPLILTINARPVPVPRPDVRVELRQPTARGLPYRWFIEPGIPQVTAEVTARTLDGTVVVVTRRQVSGGELLEGSYFTTQPGPVTFELTLNGQPYGEALRVQ